MKIIPKANITIPCSKCNATITMPLKMRPKGDLLYGLDPNVFAEEIQSHNWVVIAHESVMTEIHPEKPNEIYECFCNTCASRHVVTTPLYNMRVDFGNEKMD